jgi:hypothetical protein
MGIVCPIVASRPLTRKPAFPSSALPASGFVGIISARDIKAPLTGCKDGKRFDKKKYLPADRCRFNTRRYTLIFYC